jgi:predicted RNase H-like HicB family nuclease
MRRKVWQQSAAAKVLRLRYKRNLLTYKAMYKFLDDGFHGEVLNFAGVITCGKTLNETRKLLADALVDMAQTNLLLGESLLIPNQSLKNEDSDLKKPIHLILHTSSKVKIVSELEFEEA